MSLYAYISTKTTADPYIPPTTGDLRILSRNLSDAFVGLSGGHQVVGEIKFFPIQRSVPGYLLCDGREVEKASFRDLYSYIGDTQGTPVDGARFVLPNLIGAAAFTPAATATTETTDAGSTISVPPTDPGLPADYDYWNEVDSGGRPRWYQGPPPEYFP